MTALGVAVDASGWLQCWYCRSGWGLVDVIAPVVLVFECAQILMLPVLLLLVRGIEQCLGSRGSKALLGYHSSARVQPCSATPCYSSAARRPSPSAACLTTNLTVPLPPSLYTLSLLPVHTIPLLSPTPLSRCAPLPPLLYHNDSAAWRLNPKSSLLSAPCSLSAPHQRLLLPCFPPCLDTDLFWNLLSGSVNLFVHTSGPQIHG